MVKLNLDSNCELVKIGVQGAIYEVFALEIDGHSPVVTTLANWSDRSPSDFRAIIKGLRIAASIPRKDIKGQRCISIDRKGRGVYEIAARGKEARLFYFYLDSPMTVIVCLDTFWKSGGKRKQDTAFDDAANLMEEYVQWRRKHLR